MPWTSEQPRGLNYQSECDLVESWYLVQANIMLIGMRWHSVQGEEAMLLSSPHAASHTGCMPSGLMPRMAPNNRNKMTNQPYFGETEKAQQENCKP